MVQANFDFLTNTTGFVTPLGGPEGQPVPHSTLSSPLVLSGTYAREFRWLTGNSTIEAVLNATASGGEAWLPVSDVHAYSLSIAARVSSTGTTNKGVGLSAKTGRVGTNVAFPNLASGYHLFLGRWNDGSVIHGVEGGLTLLLVDENANGATARSITVATGLSQDVWHRFRMQVVPNGLSKSGSAASIIAGDMATNAADMRVSTGVLGSFTSDVVGKFLTLSGTGEAENTGSFLVTRFVTSSVVEVRNTAATIPDSGNGSISWATSVQDVITVYRGVQNAGVYASIIAGAPAGQMRVSDLTGLTASSVGRLLTISDASSSGNNGSFPIVSNSETEADVTNASAVIPDANNGNIEWSEPMIWTAVHTEVVDSSYDYYTPWADSVSNRFGIAVHNAAGAGGSLYADDFVAMRTPTRPPTSHWSFDDDDTSGATALDRGVLYDGTIVNAVPGASGQVAEAYEFDGSGDYVSLGTGALDYDSSFSVAAWVLLDVTGSDRRIIQNRGTGSFGTQDGWYLRVDSTDQVEFSLESGGSYSSSVAGTITPGVWAHVAATFDSSTGAKQVFINGAFSASDTVAGLIGADFTSGRESIIGASKVSATISQSWDGRLDEVAVWEGTILSADFIQKLYQLGLAGGRI